MEITKINTRFMDANKTDYVFDLLADHYGMGEVCSDDIDWSEALFSNGFIRAIENDMIPVLGSEQLSFLEKNSFDEYHHFIYNEECYIIYFKEVE